MANNGKNIPKTLVDGDAVRDLINDFGYSLRRMSKKIGCSDRSLRDYLKNGIIPTVIFEKIKDVIGEELDEKHPYSPGTTAFEMPVSLPYMTEDEIKALCKIRDKYCQWGEVVVMDKAIRLIQFWRGD